MSGSTRRREVAVAVIEDEPLLCDMLAESLERHPSINVLARYTNGRRAMASQLVPLIDVAVLDVDLGPPPDGVEVAVAWRERNPRLGIVFLTNLLDPSIVLQMPEVGHFGLAYLYKRTAAGVDKLVGAVLAAAAGEIAVDPVVTHALPEGHQALAALTPHQERVLRLVARGASNRRIAAELHMSTKAVENATAGALRALGIDGSDPDVNVRVLATLAFLRLASGV